jgi:hypothetical protein
MPRKEVQTLSFRRVDFGRCPFFALQGSLLQRTPRILQPFCNEPLVLAYLSVM